MRNTRSFVASLAFVMAVVAPGLAHAQGMTEATAEPKLWVGGHLGLSPLGSLKATAKANGNEASMSFDASTAFEVGAHFDVPLTPFLSVGLAPAVLFNVKSTDDTDSATQLDLPIRVTAGGMVAPKLKIYGFVAPGYTILFLPADDNGNTTHPSGFMVGFGGGVGYKIAPRVAVTGELGYQFRFPSETQTVLGTPVDVSLQDNFLTIALGVVAGL